MPRSGILDVERHGSLARTNGTRVDGAQNSGAPHGRTTRWDRISPVQHTPHSTITTWRANLILVLASVLSLTAVLLTIELGLRRWDPTYLVRTRGVHVYSTVYGWAPRHNVSAVIDGHHLTLNALGHRGRDLGPKQPGQKRVVVIGDSVAYGLDVSDEETFAQILDTRRNGLEVTNLAVQGYGTGQQLVKLEREGLPLHPDVVLLAYCENNDLADTLSPSFLYNERVPKPHFELTASGLHLREAHLRMGVLRWWSTWLLDHSQLFHRAVAIIQPREAGTLHLLHGGPDEKVHWTERKARLLEREEAGLRLTAALIERMQADAKAENGQLVLAVFPGRAAYRNGSRITRRLGEIANANGIVFVDLAQALRGAATNYRAFAEDKLGHLSPQGHRLVADVLEPILIEASQEHHGP